MEMPKSKEWYLRMAKLEEGCEIGAGVPDRPRGAIRLCVVGIVTRDKKILIGRRKQLDSAHNKWVMPGGGVEFGETLIEAVRREVKEESGLDVVVGKLAFVREHFDDNMHRVVLFYFAESYAGVPVDASDLAAPEFVPIEEALSRDLSTNTRAALEMLL